MPKTHSTVKHFDDIGALYTEKVVPTTTGQLLGEGQQVGDMQQLEHGGEDLKNTGPENADGFVPVENDSKKKSEKELGQSAHSEDKLSQPLGEGKKKKKGKGKPPWLKDDDDDDDNGDGDDEDSKESDKKSVKKESNKINNSTMRENTNKSTFDRLFATVMNEDLDDLDMAMGDEEGGGFGDEEGLGDEEGNGDMITLDLPRDVAETLHGALGELLNGGGEENGDIEDLEDAEGLENGMGEEGMHPGFRESHVELQAAPDSVSKLATTNGGNNKVGGTVTPAGGSASSDSSGQDDGGKPKAQADGVPGLIGKSNKVSGKVTGGNKHLFKT